MLKCRNCGTPQKKLVGENCELCKAKDLKVRAEQSLETALQKIEDMEKGALISIATHGLVNPIGDAPADIYAGLCAAFGGVTGISTKMLATYHQAPPGSAVREKILAGLMRSAQTLEQNGHLSKPVDTLSDADLRKELMARFEKAKQAVVIEVDSNAKVRDPDVLQRTDDGS